MNYLVLILLFFSFLIDRSINQTMLCTYGSRGSLTAVCSNIYDPKFFRKTYYRFDYLDETFTCKNCTLGTIAAGTFDLSGNELKTVNLEGSKIEKLEQNAFIGLVFMKNLILRNNTIKTLAPDVFHGVKRLESIDLSYNLIENLSNKSLSNLDNLVYFNVSNNKITQIEEDAFIGLEMLNNMDLSHNLLKNICVGLEDIKHVQFINAGYNKINSITTYCFKENIELISLYLNDNEITSLPAEPFRALIHLSKLDLSRNRIQIIDSSSFLGLFYLEELWLDNNKINDLHVKTFRGLHDLRFLQLSNNLLTTFKLNYFGSMPELRFLNLSYNKIESLERIGILDLHNLHNLDFKNNSIKSVDYKLLLFHMKRLSYLDIRNNPLSCNEVKGLMEYSTEISYIDLKITNSTKDNCDNTTKMADIYENNVTEESLAYANKVEDSRPSGSLVGLSVLLAIAFVCIACLIIMQYRNYKILQSFNFQNNMKDRLLMENEELAAQRGDL